MEQIEGPQKTFSRRDEHPEDTATAALVASRRWFREQYDKFERDVDGLQVTVDGLREGRVRDYYEACLAGLRAIGDGMRSVHRLLSERSLDPWSTPDSPLIAYISCAYFWCNAVVVELARLVAHCWSVSWDRRRRVLADQAGDYVDEFLDPLTHRLDKLLSLPWADESVRTTRPAILSLQSRMEQLCDGLSPRLSLVRPVADTR